MPDALRRARLWSELNELSPLEEAADKLAPLASKDLSAKSIYDDLRHASGDTIPPLEARLRIIEARKRRP